MGSRMIASCLATLAAAALLANPAPQERSMENCSAIDDPSPARSVPRVRAFIDPATGKLRAPTADELRQIAEARRSRAGAPPFFDVVVYPDGMKSVDLQDAFLVDFIAEKLPDGTTRFRCVPRSWRASASTPASSVEK